jgi:hypothetical protein
VTESLREDGPRQDEIDRGEAPASTIPQLVSALRQSILAAVIECDTAWTYTERDDRVEALASIDRLKDRLVAADKKMTLAMEAARGTH